MKVYIVTCARGFGLVPRHEYHGIYLTEEEARAHAKKFKEPLIYVYDLDKPRKGPTGGLYAVEGIDNIEDNK